MPSDVMLLDDLDLDALERAFAVNYSPTIAVEIAGRRSGAKSDEYAWLLDADTWAMLRATLLPVVRPMFTEAFLIGAHLASQQPGKRGLKHGDGSHDEEDHGNWADEATLGDEYVQEKFPARKAVYVRTDGAYVVAPGELEHAQFGKQLNPEGKGMNGLYRERGWVTLRAGLYRSDDLIVAMAKQPTSAQMRAIEGAAEGRTIDYWIDGAPDGRFRDGKRVQFATLERAVRDAYAGRPESLVAQYRSLDIDATLDIMRGRKAPPISLADAGLPLPFLPFDFDIVMDAALQIIASYVDDWWLQFSTTTQDALRAIIARARTEGLTTPEVIDLVEPLFGPTRARAIAVTETTRLLGLGAQETYKNAGFVFWQWRTVMDARVDPDCEQLGEQNDGEGAIFPMTTPFMPLHPNCRCWPVPYGDPSMPSAMIPPGALPGASFPNFVV